MNLLDPEPGLFAWEVIIFFLFLFILKKLIWGRLVAGLKQREKSISDSLISVQKITVKMEQWKKEQEVMKKEVLQQISDMQKVAKGVSNALFLEAREKAKEEFDKAINDARLYCQRLQREAINDIKSRTGSQVVKITETILREEFSRPNKRQDFLKSLISDIDFQVSTRG